jgi:rsbT co-antagonist protein RsbR
MNQDSPSLSTSSIGDMRSLYRLSDDDVQRIRAFGRGIVPQLELFIEGFYDWLSTQPEFEAFLSDPHVLARNKRMLHEYWEEFFRAELDERYLTSRRRLGETHARIGLPLTTYFAAMNTSFDLLTNERYEGELSGAELVAATRAVTRLVHMDTAIVVETYTTMINEMLETQSKSLMEMSTPVTEIWAGVLLLPLVGIIDSKRAQDMMNAVLAKIADMQARFFILDISGVGVVDTAVANHLIKITKATALMGCECTISGVSPAIAQTIVDLGIDVGQVRTTANMRDALAGTLTRLGLEL